MIHHSRSPPPQAAFNTAATTCRDGRSKPRREEQGRDTGCEASTNGHHTDPLDSIQAFLLTKAFLVAVATRFMRIPDNDSKQHYQGVCSKPQSPSCKGGPVSLGCAYAALEKHGHDGNRYTSYGCQQHAQARVRWGHHTRHEVGP
jgi:hypothetical protein